MIICERLVPPNDHLQEATTTRVKGVTGQKEEKKEKEKMEKKEEKKKENGCGQDRTDGRYQRLYKRSSRT